MSQHKQMTLSDKAGVRTLVAAASEFGVKHVIICPGSRNAPLTISFHRSGLFECHSIADERVAAFYALGMALASGDPVAVICTSGSAGINMAPALAEAYYLRAPVIAITADRPLAWTDQGNGQTVRQEGMYANFSRFGFSLISEPANETDAWHNRRKLSQAFNTALVNDPGPVHINVPLSEPLYGTVTSPAERSERFYRSAALQSAPSDETLKMCVSDFENSPRVMVLAGQMLPDQKLDAILEQMALRSNVVVLTETSSNLHNPEAISTIDRLVMPLAGHDLLETLMPDLLITIGGMVVSKKIKALIRGHAPAQHWHIHPQEQGLDTYMNLTREINCPPATFLAALHEGAGQGSDATLRAKWKTLQKAAIAGHQSYLEGIAFSDFKAFEILDKALPEDIVLHMANSSPVRYFQLFGTRKDTTYHANRGTSGIDGSTSTAAGWAMAHPDKQHILVTGDVAFLYDSNALWNRSFPKNLKMVVINNSGGGIFRIIDGAENVDELEAFFEAHHPVDLAALSAAYGVHHLSASDEVSLQAAMAAFNASPEPCILEIHTPAKENAPILKGYFRHIKGHFQDDNVL